MQNSCIASGVMMSSDWNLVDSECYSVKLSAGVNFIVRSFVCVASWYTRYSMWLCVFCAPCLCAWFDVWVCTPHCCRCRVYLDCQSIVSTYSSLDFRQYSQFKTKQSSRIVESRLYFCWRGQQIQQWCKQRLFHEQDFFMQHQRF